MNLVIFLTIPLLSRIREVRPQQEFSGTPTFVGLSEHRPSRKPVQEKEQDNKSPATWMPSIPRQVPPLPETKSSHHPNLEVELPEFEFKIPEMDLAQKDLAQPKQEKRVFAAKEKAASSSFEPRVEPEPEEAPLQGAKQPAQTEFSLDRVDQQPRIVARTRPDYPYRARRRNISGQVVLKFLVDTQGRVTRVSVISAEPEGVFEESAREAVSKWRFKPGLIKGKPVKTWVRVPIRFKFK